MLDLKAAGKPETAESVTSVTEITKGAETKAVSGKQLQSQNFQPT